MVEGRERSVLSSSPLCQREKQKKNLLTFMPTITDSICVKEG